MVCFSHCRPALASTAMNILWEPFSNFRIYRQGLLQKVTPVGNATDYAQQWTCTILPREHCCVVFLQGAQKDTWNILHFHRKRLLLLHISLLLTNHQAEKNHSGLVQIHQQNRRGNACLIPSIYQESSASLCSSCRLMLTFGI